MNGLIRCVAKALIKSGVNVVTLGIGGEILDEIWNYWKDQTDADQRRKELEQLANMGNQQSRQQATQVVKQEAISSSPQLAQAITTYLTQIPAHVRRSLRRPSDPSGTTVSLNLVPQRAADLQSLLPERMPRFQPGQQPLENVPWVLEELLGVGGFGEVWKAHHMNFSELKAALKFCLDSEARERLLQHEAKVVLQVQHEGRHPNIVELRQAFLQNDPPCLEYEYVPGGELTDWLDGRRLSPFQAHTLILNLAKTVGFAHRLSPAVVHRDLKPANILLGEVDGKPQFKVADFGIGGLVSNQAIKIATTRPTMLSSAHSLLYASPQQKSGAKPDVRDDVYSLGVIWYQLLTGNLASEAPRGQGWKKHLARVGVDFSFIALLERCVDDQPEDRPIDAMDL